MPKTPLKYFVRLTAVAVYLSIATQLAGCGFQLRQPVSIDNALQPIWVTGDLQLARELRRALVSANIGITDSRRAAGSVIELHNVIYDAREHAIAFDGRTAELRRLLSVDVIWRSSSRSAADGEKTQLMALPLTTETLQINNPDNSAAAQREAELLSAELRSALARQIVDRLWLTAGEPADDNDEGAP